ncbi:MAG TPA: hypothetical protein VHI99_00720 [Vicinamibacterales bacterium]|jgi:hypothetical protein|nr:hypothetical protein [Vicinamibacterales bacterium]
MVLSLLSYFEHDDERPIDIVRCTRQADGRWLLHHAYKGRTYFQLERVGSASRWNTLRAMRVLKWWEGRGPGGDS